MFYAGIAANERDLFGRLLSVVTGAPLVGRFSYVGTGNGSIDSFHMPPEFYDTLIELECTVEDDNEAEFSVTIGGVTELSAVTNIPYTYQGLTFMITMGSTAYEIGDKFTVAAQGEATFANASPDLPEVYFTTKAAGVEEDITIACTLASVSGEDGEFIVSGSVTGAMGTFTQNELYDHAAIRVTVPDGFDFEVADQWVIPLRATALPSNYQWEILNEDVEVKSTVPAESDHTQSTRVALRGKGNSGTENIYIGLLREAIEGIEDTWSFTGYTAWDDEAIDQDANLGFIHSDAQPIVVMPQNELTYYVSINGRRIMGAIVAGDVTEHFYLGHLMQHQAPTYDPYPLFIGGSAVHALKGAGYLGDGHIESTAQVHTAYWKPTAHTDSVDSSQANLYVGNNDYRLVTYGYINSVTDTGLTSRDYDKNPTMVFPYNLRALERMRRNFDGTYSPVPVYIIRATSENNTVKGRFDGLYGISSDGAQQQGNVFVFDGRYHIVFYNVFRNGAGDFCAIEVK